MWLWFVVVVCGFFVIIIPTLVLDFDFDSTWTWTRVWQKHLRSIRASNTKPFIEAFKLVSAKIS